MAASLPMWTALATRNLDRNRFSSCQSIRATNGESALNIPAGPYSIDWSPDGRLLLADTSPEAAPVGRPGLYIVNAQTGEATKVTTPYPDGAITESKWLANGRLVVFLERWHAVVVHDLDSGEERTLHRIAGQGTKLTSLVASPDGRQVAFREWRNATSPSALMLMSIDGGTPTSIHSFRGPANNGLAEACCMAWSPDGEDIVFADSTGPQNEWELWRLALAGGAPEKLGVIGPGRYRFFSLHRDGTRLAFGVMNIQRLAGSYVLENFLPAIELVRPGR